MAEEEATAEDTPAAVMATQAETMAMRIEVITEEEEEVVVVIQITII